MVYFKDMNYQTNGIMITTDKEQAAHFKYEDQSSIAAIPVIVSLINLASDNQWESAVDMEDEDRRYIIVREN